MRHHVEKNHKKYLVVAFIAIVGVSIGWYAALKACSAAEKRLLVSEISRTLSTADNIRLGCELRDAQAFQVDLARVTFSRDSLRYELAKCKGRRPHVPAIPTKPTKPLRYVPQPDHCKSHPKDCIPRAIGTPVVDTVVIDTCKNTCKDTRKCIPGLYENLMSRLPITGRYPDSGGGVWNGVWKDCK